jgi:hypothetical protein
MTLILDETISYDERKITRVEAILNNDSSYGFFIEQNPDHTPYQYYGEWRTVHSFGVNTVNQYDSIIVQKSAQYNVDANLVRSIMYLENGQDVNDYLFPSFGDGVPPMNIHPQWSALMPSGSDFTNPATNIEAGVKLLSLISSHLLPEDRTIVNIATLYNSLAQNEPLRYGARIEDIYDRQLWEVSEADYAPEGLVTDGINNDIGLYPASILKTYLTQNYPDLNGFETMARTLEMLSIPSIQPQLEAFRTSWNGAYMLFDFNDGNGMQLIQKVNGQASFQNFPTPDPEADNPGYLYVEDEKGNLEAVVYGQPTRNATLQDAINLSPSEKVLNNVSIINPNENQASYFGIASAFEVYLQKNFYKLDDLDLSLTSHYNLADGSGSYIQQDAQILVNGENGQSFIVKAIDVVDTLKDRAISEVAKKVSDLSNAVQGLFEKFFDTDDSNGDTGIISSQNKQLQEIEGELLRRILNGEGLDEIIEDMAPRHTATFAATKAFDLAIKELGELIPEYKYDPASTSNSNVAIGASKIALLNLVGKLTTDNADYQGAVQDAAIEFAVQFAAGKAGIATGDAVIDGAIAVTVNLLQNLASGESEAVSFASAITAASVAFVSSFIGPFSSKLFADQISAIVAAPIYSRALNIWDGVDQSYDAFAEFTNILFEDPSEIFHGAFEDYIRSQLSAFDDVFIQGTIEHIQDVFAEIFGIKRGGEFHYHNETRGFAIGQVDGKDVIIAVREAGGYLQTTPAISDIIGSLGHEVIVGGASNNLLYADGGDDMLEGRGGEDILFAGIGHDHVEAGDGADYVEGNDINILIYRKEFGLISFI